MKYAILQKKNFDKFVMSLLQKIKVIAPVAKGNNQYSFEEISSSSEIALKYIPTILPPKKYFMPQYETLAEYDVSRGKQTMQAVVEYEEMVLFGVHTCDLAGIQNLNVVFSGKPNDPNYLTRKKNILLIGLECNDYCDEYASCHLMGNDLPNGGYDLFFTDIGDYFIIHINTMEGESLLEKCCGVKEAEADNFLALEKLREKKRKIFHNGVQITAKRLPEIFGKSYDSKVWDNLGDRCLGCASCTNVCPTCYCFDVEDVPELDLQTGKRIRVWDSCQNDPFAKVAGGEDFRKTRTARQRHRYYRKFKFPIVKYDRFFCTGCGRCSRSCMANINLKETLDSLVKENI